MPFETHPVTPDRVEDFITVVNPGRRAVHCWCLHHRLTAAEVREHPDREAAFTALCSRPHPPGVVGYADGEPVAWCSIGPRSENTKLLQSRLIPALDDLDVWTIICVVIRGGHRRQGHAGRVIEGAVAWAASEGAPAVESHPVDTADGRIDATMAYIGTRQMFERCGFTVVGETQAKASGRNRLIMRRALPPTPRGR